MFERELYTDEQGDYIPGTEYADRIPVDNYNNISTGYSENGYSGGGVSKGYIGWAEDNEKWNRDFDKRREAELGIGTTGTTGTRGTTQKSKGVHSNTRASSGQSTYGEKIAPYTIGKLPTLEYDTFTAPTRDPNRISNLRARASGAGLRDLRRQTQRTIQGTSGMDATMRRMTLKDALMGYGSGVSKIMSSADRIAQSQYEQEYGDKYKEAMLNYQAGISKANAEYQARLQRLIFNAQNPQAGNRIISDRDYDYRG